MNPSSDNQEPIRTGTGDSGIGLDNQYVMQEFDVETNSPASGARARAARSGSGGGGGGSMPSCFTGSFKNFAIACCALICCIIVLSVIVALAGEEDSPQACNDNIPALKVDPDAYDLAPLAPYDSTQPNPDSAIPAPIDHASYTPHGWYSFDDAHAHGINADGSCFDCEDGAHTARSYYLANDRMRVKDGSVKGYVCSNMAEIKQDGKQVVFDQVYGGMFSRCRSHQVGFEPDENRADGGFPDITVSCLSGADGLSSCQCPAGFDEHVVSAGFMDNLAGTQCQLTEWPDYEDGDISVPSPAMNKSMVEVVLCVNKTAFTYGHWFGGMFSEVGSGCQGWSVAQRVDYPMDDLDKYVMSHDKERWIYSEGIFLNPVAEFHYLSDCPLGSIYDKEYKKHLIGEYCCPSQGDGEFCTDNQKIKQYACLYGKETPKNN